MDKPKKDVPRRIPYFYGIDSMGFYVGFLSGFRRLIPALFAFLISIPIHAQSPFAPPLPGPWSFSGTFGELRSNHFHAGLDFKTGGKEGMPVLAAADGCLSRIRQGAGGYGLALYLDHDNRFTTVYAHLHHAEPAIASFLDSVQWAQRKFEIDTAVPNSRFCFRKGDLVGISGNSGSSEGPHLHFEIRDRHTQEPLNPLSFLSAITDTVSPVIRKVALFYRIGNRFVRENTFDCMNSGRDAIEYMTGARECALGLEVTDPERLGIYRIDWAINDTIRGGFRFDRFNFNETRYVNAHVDVVEEPGGPNLRFHRLFRLPGDSCSIFDHSGTCIVDFTADTASKKVKLVISDWHGNKDSVEIRLAYSPETLAGKIPVRSEVIRTLPFGEERVVAIPGGGKLELTTRAFYQDEVCPDVFRDEKKGDLRFHPVLPVVKTSFHEPQVLVLPVPDDDRKFGQKLIAIRRDSIEGKNREVLIPADLRGNVARFKIRYGGWYALSQDSVPPAVDRIRTSLDALDGSVYSECSIRDDKSGIARYEVFRNHSWILAEFDAKSGRLRWKAGPLGQGPDLISIVIDDRCGNRVRFDSVEIAP